jgi:hypothetical protein
MQSEIMPIQKYLISYSYSHLHSSSGKRLRILNKYFLRNNGWKIITSQISKSQEDNVEQISTLIDRFIKPVSYSNTTTKRGFKKILLNILWPDKGIFWAIKTTWILIKRLLGSNESFEIVTVSYPFSSHLVGAVLKWLFPQRVELKTHYIDGFYLINKGNGAPQFLSLLSYLSEIFTYRMSSKIIVNNSKRSEFEQLFFKYKNKTIYVDELPGLYLENIKDESLSKGRCLFAGSLYLKIRNPFKVLELFKELPEFNLVLAGNLNDCQEVLNQKHVAYIGLLDEKAVIDQLKMADILINIDNQDQNQQPPGKIIEYMQLQKPIINFYINKSISGENLRKFSLKNDSYLEVNLADDTQLNLNKIRSFIPTEKPLFNVPNNFENLYRIYAQKNS